jgi:hypothetical protein
MGKTVPFFGSTAKTARGPYAADGLKPVARRQGVRRAVPVGQAERQARRQGQEPDALREARRQGLVRRARGGAGTYFIAFRKVGKTGWIIPRAAPRPFMRAALEGTKDKGRLMMVRAGVEMLDPKLP